MEHHSTLHRFKSYRAVLEFPWAQWCKILQQTLEKNAH